MTANTTESQHTSPITTTQVEDDKLFDFLPAYFGERYYSLYESLIYSTMRKICPEYKGGHWLYFNLSNGGHFMGVAYELDYKVWIESNHFAEDMSSDAASIVVNLLVLSFVAAKAYENNDEDHAEHLINQHQLMMDFAREHKEAEKILRAVD